MSPSYLFTLEVVGKCREQDVEHWLRVATTALERAGFAIDDAQAIGIDGGRGGAIDFPDPAVPVLEIEPDTDTRRMSDVPGTIA